MDWQDHSDENLDQLRRIGCATKVVVVLSIGLLVLYFLTFGDQGLSKDQAHWGAFGDYIGGIINPVVGVLTVFLVLHSVMIQRRELRLSLREVEKSTRALQAQNVSLAIQGFEQTFFSWLNIYRDQVVSMEDEGIEAVISKASGLHALQRWYNTSLGEGRNDWAYQILVSSATVPKTEEIDYNELPVFRQDQLMNNLFAAWDELYSKQLFQLDRAFRSLYRLVEWVDAQPSERLSDAQKWFYVGVIRAQLSWIELAFLFYNGMTERGASFRVLLNKYAMFSTFDLRKHPSLKFLKSLQRYEPAAFDRSAARRNLGLTA